MGSVSTISYTLLKRKNYAYIACIWISNNLQPRAQTCTGEKQRQMVITTAHQIYVSDTV